MCEFVIGHGMSIINLAREIDIHPGVINNWVTGYGSPQTTWEPRVKAVYDRIRRAAEPESKATHEVIVRGETIALVTREDYKFLFERAIDFMEAVR